MNEKPFLLRILIQIWPTIRRVINDTLFFLETIIKSFIRTVSRQV
ncbi:MAG: hypothetical protein ABSE17_00340 [Candidatus Levyibacteriota bacterium]